MNREMGARRLVARLRQPFGALLVTLASAGQRTLGTTSSDLLDPFGWVLCRAEMGPRGPPSAPAISNRFPYSPSVVYGHPGVLLVRVLCILEHLQTLSRPS